MVKSQRYQRQPRFWVVVFLLFYGPTIAMIFTEEEVDMVRSAFDDVALTTSEDEEESQAEIIKKMELMTL